MTPRAGVRRRRPRPALAVIVLISLFASVSGTADGDPMATAPPSGTSRPEPVEEASYPEVRRAAITFVESSASRSPGAGPGRSATVRVVDTQIAGLTDSAASVIVLARPHPVTASDPTASTREFAVDVRLVADEAGVWRVTDRVDPPRPAASLAPIGATSETARRVLDERRISLSGPARQDIGSGRVADGVLAVLLAAGGEHELRVHVAITGHPGTVHPTSRLSNHAVGRALDIRAIDGEPVGPSARSRSSR